MQIARGQGSVYIKEIGTLKKHPNIEQNGNNNLYYPSRQTQHCRFNILVDRVLNFHPYVQNSELLLP